MIKVNFELWYRVALLSMNVISKFLWKCILISYIIQQQKYFFFETQKNCWSLFTQFAVRKRMLCCCCYHLSSSIGHKHNFNFNKFISTFLHRFGDVNYAKQWAMVMHFIGLVECVAKHGKILKRKKNAVNVLQPAKAWFNHFPDNLCNKSAFGYWK